jgi:hypothetical protein
MTSLSLETRAQHIEDEVYHLMDLGVADSSGVVDKMMHNALKASVYAIFRTKQAPIAVTKAEAAAKEFGYAIARVFGTLDTTDCVLPIIAKMHELGSESLETKAKGIENEVYRLMGLIAGEDFIDIGGAVDKAMRYASSTSRAAIYSAELATLTLEEAESAGKAYADVIKKCGVMCECECGCKSTLGVSSLFENVSGEVVEI